MQFTDATTIQMVRDLNTILSNATDDEITPFIKTHALPRVRFRLLTATDTLGRNIFYGRLTDLANPNIQRAAELLLDKVLGNEIVRGGLQRIVAALACAWMTTQIAAQLEEQAKFAGKLEKEALADLDAFIRSPVLGGVISAVSATVLEKPEYRSFGLALDVDPQTLDTIHKTAKQFSEAQEAGELRFYVDGTLCKIDVRPGDTPSQLLRKLSLTTIQLAGNKQIEIISMDKPHEAQLFGRVLLSNDVSYAVQVQAATSEATLQTRTNAGSLATLASISLVKKVGADYRPGIEGLTLGYGSDFSAFQPALNPTILGDIKTGDFILPVSPDHQFHQSDVLAFRTTAPLEANSVFKYRISQVAIGTPTAPVRSNAEVSITVQEGWTSLDLVEAIAKDLAKRRSAQQVLGAVLPVIELTNNGTSTFCPALDLVGYTTEQEAEVRYMFEIKELPAGLETTLANRVYEAAVGFDSNPDSVVVYAIQLGRTETAELSATANGSARAVNPVQSSQMEKALDDVRRMTQGGWWS